MVRAEVPLGGATGASARCKIPILLVWLGRARGRANDERLTADIIELARQYGRYGYRKIAELLRQAGWTINDKRVERIWQREGLVPHKQPKRGRLWLTNGPCIRLRPEQRNH